MPKLNLPRSLRINGSLPTIFYSEVFLSYLDFIRLFSQKWSDHRMIKIADVSGLYRIQYKIKSVQNLFVLVVNKITNFLVCDRQKVFLPRLFQLTLLAKIDSLQNDR